MALTVVGWNDFRKRKEPKQGGGGGGIVSHGRDMVQVKGI